MPEGSASKKIVSDQLRKHARMPCPVGTLLDLVNRVLQTRLGVSNPWSAKIRRVGLEEAADDVSAVHNECVLPIVTPLSPDLAVQQDLCRLVHRVAGSRFGDPPMPPFRDVVDQAVLDVRDAWNELGLYEAPPLFQLSVRTAQCWWDLAAKEGDFLDHFREVQRVVDAAQNAEVAPVVLEAFPGNSALQTKAQVVAVRLFRSLYSVELARNLRKQTLEPLIPISEYLKRIANHTVDLGLLDRHAAGDPSAWCALQKRHQDDLQTVLSRELSDKKIAEEVSEAVFVELKERWPARDFDPDKLVLRQLAGIALQRNEVWDEINNKQSKCLLAYFSKQMFGAASTDTEDACHDTFVKALERLKRADYDPSYSLSTYLQGVVGWGVLRNWQRNHIGIGPVPPPPPPPPPPPLPPTAAVYWELLQHLCLTRMPNHVVAHLLNNLLRCGPKEMLDFWDTSLSDLYKYFEMRYLPQFPNANHAKFRKATDPLRQRLAQAVEEVFPGPANARLIETYGPIPVGDVPFKAFFPGHPGGNPENLISAWCKGLIDELRRKTKLTLTIWGWEDRLGVLCESGSRMYPRKPHELLVYLHLGLLGRPDGAVLNDFQKTLGALLDDVHSHFISLHHHDLQTFECLCAPFNQTMREKIQRVYWERDYETISPRDKKRVVAEAKLEEFGPKKANTGTASSDWKKATLRAISDWTKALIPLLRVEQHPKNAWMGSLERLCSGLAALYPRKPHQIIAYLIGPVLEQKPKDVVKKGHLSLFHLFADFLNEFLSLFDGRGPAARKEAEIHLERAVASLRRRLGAPVEAVYFEPWYEDIRGVPQPKQVGDLKKQRAVGQLALQAFYQVDPDPVGLVANWCNDLANLRRGA